MTTKTPKDINGRTLEANDFVWYNDVHLCKIEQVKLNLIYLSVTMPGESLYDTAFTRKFIEEGKIGWVLAEVVRKATFAELEQVFLD